MVFNIKNKNKKPVEIHTIRVSRSMELLFGGDTKNIKNIMFNTKYINNNKIASVARVRKN